MFFFSSSLDACFIIPYSDWLFYWELLPMLCMKFRKRVLEGSNCKYFWLFIETQESYDSCLRDLSFNLVVWTCQWLKKPVVHEFAAINHTGLYQSTRVFHRKPLSCWARRMLGRHPDHDIIFIFLEGKNHNGNWTWVKQKMILPKCITRTRKRKVCVALVHWEDAERRFSLLLFSSYQVETLFYLNQ